MPPYPKEWKVKMIVRLLLLLVLLPLQGFAREVPIQDFFKDPEFTSISVSPDGKHMAVTVPQADRTVLAVLRVSDQGVVGKWDYGENRHFRQVYWANNNRLLFFVTFKTGRFDFETAKGDLYASNIDGTGRIEYRNEAARRLTGTHHGVLVDEAIERHLELGRAGSAGAGVVRYN